MLFNSFEYAVFLPLVFAAYWLCAPKWRVIILLAASYIFYMSWRPAYVFLILGLTVGNYFLGLEIAKEGRKKFWLTIAVTGNLLVLAFFKYAFFIDELLASLLKPAGIDFPKIPFNIVLPLAISFFVFEFIHYVVDVYRGSEPVRSFKAFALFASFFPTQIAGPIKRYQDFVPQFLQEAKFKLEYLDQGVSLILIGLAKKILFADPLAHFVQGGFANPELFTGLDLWLFAYAFAFQIYFDFSGYTDIARGSAKLFGYKVPANFNLPYLAGSVAEFWHRWHISLSTWLRDYLFIPLGGSRAGRLIVARNLLITMTLGGLWHGAAMHFLVWGIFHGAALVIHREFTQLTAGWNTLRKLLASIPGHFMAQLLTFHVICVGWVLFRVEDMHAAQIMLGRMFCLLPAKEHASSIVSNMASNLVSINYPIIYPLIFLLLPVLFLAHFGMDYINKKGLVDKMPFSLKAAYCFALMFIVVVFSPDTSPKFIYFQF